MEIICIALSVVCAALLFLLIITIQAARDISDEKFFWRYSAITMSDEAFNILSNTSELPGDDYLRGIDKTSHDVFSKTVQTIAKDCSKFGYDWLDGNDTEYIYEKALGIKRWRNP